MEKLKSFRELGYKKYFTDKYFKQIYDLINFLKQNNI